MTAQLIANDLARRPGTFRMGGLLHDLGLIKDHRGVAPDDDTVGIWARTAEGRWQRDEDRTAEWGDWADVETLDVGTDVSVLWCGESVARCHFFDPVFSAGDALEHALATALGRSVSVIDLACRNQTLEQLRETIARGMAHLTPNAVVVFAGNNWEPYLENRGYWDTAREAGLAVASESNWELYRANVTRELARIADLVVGRGVPLLWVVPEYNLRGWQPAAGEMVPWLPDGRLRAWFDAHDQATAALAERDIERANTCAAEMLALDHGYSRRSVRLAAECARLSGDFERERELLELAKNAPPLLRDTPRCTSEAQRAIRLLAERGVRVVDLPQLLKDVAPQGAPGWDHFLDYCHLNGAGLRIVLQNVAEALAETFGQEHAAVAEHVPRPDAHVEAGATVCAAIHCAHWGQPAESIRHLLDRAVALDPALKGFLRRFVRAQLRATPRDLQLEADAEPPHVNPHVARYLSTELACLYDEVLIDEVGAICGMETEIEALRYARLDPDVADVDYLDDFFRPHWRYSKKPHWMMVHDRTCRVPLAFPGSGKVRVWGAVRVPRGRKGYAAVARVRVERDAPRPLAIGSEWTPFDLVFERGDAPRLSHLLFEFDIPPWDGELDPLAVEPQPALAQFVSLYASAVRQPVS